jgi:pyridoxine/pyridoxamine 5'-phosphate oxidase
LLGGKRGGFLSDELKNLDLSSKSFDQFVDFFFNRTVVPDKEQFDYFLTSPTGEQYDEAVPSSPAILVKLMTKLFSEFGSIANKYSLAQVDQAVWGLLGANLRLYEFFFDASVPLRERLECVRSIYHVYSDMWPS